jgi:hypothetical protein
MNDFLQDFSNINWGNLQAAGVLFGAAATSLLTLIPKNLKKFAMRRVLMLKTDRRRCAVSLPVYRREVFGSRRELLFARETRPTFALNTMLTSCKVEPVLIPDAENTPGGLSPLDEIHIGGPIANQYTNHYIKEYLPCLQMQTTETGLANARRESDISGWDMDFGFVRTVKDEAGEGFVLDGEHYGYRHDQKGHAFVIRIKVPAGDKQKTVHLLFGTSTNATAAAVQYFVKSCPTAPRALGTGNYIGVFEVNGSGKRVGRIKWLKNPHELIAEGNTPASHC